MDMPIKVETTCRGDCQQQEKTPLIFSEALFASFADVTKGCIIPEAPQALLTPRAEGTSLLAPTPRSALSSRLMSSWNGADEAKGLSLLRVNMLQAAHGSCRPVLAITFCGEAKCLNNWRVRENAGCTSSQPNRMRLIAPQGVHFLHAS